MSTEQPKSVVKLSSLEASVTQLISRCLDTDDEARPGSATIVEELDPHIVRQRLPCPGMLSTIVTRIIEYDTSTHSKTHKQGLGDEVRLLGRLLRTGLRPTSDNVQAASEYWQDCRRPKATPTWKTSRMEQAVSLLRCSDPPRPVVANQDSLTTRTSEPGPSSIKLLKPTNATRSQTQQQSVLTATQSDRGDHHVHGTGVKGQVHSTKEWSPASHESSSTIRDPNRYSDNTKHAATQTLGDARTVAAKSKLPMRGPGDFMSTRPADQAKQIQTTEPPARQAEERKVSQGTASRRQVPRDKYVMMPERPLMERTELPARRRRTGDGDAFAQGAPSY